MEPIYLIRADMLISSTLTTVPVEREWSLIRHFLLPTNEKNSRYIKVNCIIYFLRFFFSPSPYFSSDVIQFLSKRLYHRFVSNVKGMCILQCVSCPLCTSDIYEKFVLSYGTEIGIFIDFSSIATFFTRRKIYCNEIHR